MKGPIQNRLDFEKFPFDEIPTLFWEKYTPHFDAIRKVMPAGMKALWRLWLWNIRGQRRFGWI